MQEFQCDYTSNIPSMGGVFPSGLVELARKESICGNVTVQNQYNFGIYCVFPKPPGDDERARANADWVMEFQQWVQEQSVRGLVPKFGNVADIKETARAQNGVLYEASKDEGVAMYLVTLNIQFSKYYEVM